MATPFPRGMPIRQAPGMNQMPVMPVQQGMAGDLAETADFAAGEIDQYLEREQKLKQLVQKRKDAMAIEAAKQEWKQKEYELDVAADKRDAAEEERTAGTYEREDQERKDLKARTEKFYTDYNALDPALLPADRERAARGLLASYGGQKPEDFLEKEFGKSGASQAKGEIVNSRGKQWFVNKVDGTVEPIMDAQGNQLPADPRYKVVPVMDGLQLISGSGAGNRLMEGETPATYKAKLARQEKAFKFLKFKNKTEGDRDTFNDTIALAKTIAGNKHLWKATGAGSWISYIPSTQAANVSADLDRLAAKGIINVMNRLKSESPTGSTGFGALNREEMATIASADSKLKDRNISAADMRTELNRIITVLERVKARQRKYELLMDKEVEAMYSGSVKNPPPAAPKASKTAPIDDPDGVFPK
jgi:hypothetical protein